MKNIFKHAVFAFSILAVTHSASAENLYPQEQLAGDIGKYYAAPKFREDQGHPLRFVAYIFHPVGWLLREGVVRPMSYLFSTSDTLSGIVGYRESYDIQRESCLLTPLAKCSETLPYNYNNKKPVAVLEEAVPPPAPAVVVFPNVNFDFNSSKLNEAGKAKAKEVAALLEQQSAVSVSIEGHADDRGSDTYNQKLGLRRAESVKAELVTLGVAGEKLATVSFGESKPLINEKTPYARAMNRRVEVHVQ